MTNKDALVVTLSDMHSGGTTALCPNRFFQGKHTNHTPTSDQVRMWKHFEKCAAEIRKARKGKTLWLVHDGDAIDGVHHDTLEIFTRMVNEQMDVHVELMQAFKKMVDFREGDRLYYVTGTQVHVEDTEDLIAQRVGAIPDGPVHVFDELRLEINGKRVVWVHHGPSAGKGANRGNALRSWLKNIFYDSIAEGQVPPHYVITGHTHDPDWNTYNGRMNGKYHQMQGLICPSWQMKTRYALKVAPVKKNKIGLQYFVITKDGIIGDPVELLME